MEEWLRQGPNKRMTPSRRVKCHQTRYSDPKPSTVHQTGASPYSGSLALASLNLACRYLVPAFPQRSPPLLLTTAACGGLRSTPDCRPRRALLHLSYSCAPSYADGARDTRPKADIGRVEMPQCSGLVSPMLSFGWQRGRVGSAPISIQSRRDEWNTRKRPWLSCASDWGVSRRQKKQRPSATSRLGAPTQTWRSRPSRCRTKPKNFCVSKRAGSRQWAPTRR